MKDQKIVYLKQLSDGTWRFGWHPVFNPEIVTWSRYSWPTRDKVMDEAERYFSTFQVTFRFEEGASDE
jgi:hypothetical protein